MTQPQLAIRLSCFSLVTAVESDLRNFLVSNQFLPTSFLPADVREKAEKRWLSDRAPSALAATPDDRQLLPYCDFGDLAKALRTGRVGLVDSGAAHKVAGRLDELVGARNRVCHSRPLEPDDFVNLLDLATDAPAALREVHWTQVEATLIRLKEDPSFVLHLQIPEFWSEGQRREHNLPLPEFDDTGFLGRAADRRELTKLLLSPHPVVSVVGEGGVGKTALAVRCLYDLVDSKDCPFDAVAWVSLKGRVLTSSGAMDLRDSIRSVLGLFQSAAQQLGAPAALNATVEDCIAEIISYMQCFRILLAIDNLETLAWRDLRPFLAGIPNGSKVLITSRIGLGEVELRYSLDPLDVNTAVGLARRFSRTLNCGTIFQQPEATLARTCKLLHYNPLLIKWYVSSVASGAQPSKLLDKSSLEFKEALKFCFENLFERLSEDERLLVHVLACARRPLSQVELYYLTRDVGRDQIDWALNTLHHSSMLRRTQEGSGAYNPSGILYSLTEIASEYVSQYAAPSRELFVRVNELMHELTVTSQAHTVQRSVYKYDPNAVFALPGDESIVASYLRRALKASRDGDFSLARREVDEAKSLLPTFSETYRVSAFVHWNAEDLYSATQDFDAAVELAPSSPILRYHYWLFLFSKLQDLNGALRQIDAALALEAEDRVLLGARAQTLMRLGRRKEAAELYELLLDQLHDRPRKYRVATLDQAAECYRRLAEQDWQMRDTDACAQHISRAMAVLKLASDAGDFDHDMILRLGRVADDWCRYAIMSGDLGIARACVSKLGDMRSRFPAKGLLVSGWDVLRTTFSSQDPDFERAAAGVVAASPAPSTLAGGDLRFRGVIKNVVSDKKFGFITGLDGQEWFFHSSALESIGEWPSLKPGVAVTFGVGSNLKGPCAMSVRIGEPHVAG